MRGVHTHPADLLFAYDPADASNKNTSNSNIVGAMVMGEGGGGSDAGLAAWVSVIGQVARNEGAFSEVEGRWVPGVCV